MADDDAKSTQNETKVLSDLTAIAARAQEAREAFTTSKQGPASLTEQFHAQVALDKLVPQLAHDIDLLLGRLREAEAAKKLFREKALRLASERYSAIEQLREAEAQRIPDQRDDPYGFAAGILRLEAERDALAERLREAEAKAEQLRAFIAHEAAPFFAHMTFVHRDPADPINDEAAKLIDRQADVLIAYEALKEHP